MGSEMCIRDRRELACAERARDRALAAARAARLARTRVRVLARGEVGGAASSLSESDGSDQEATVDGRIALRARSRPAGGPDPPTPPQPSQLDQMACADACAHALVLCHERLVALMGAGKAHGAGLTEVPRRAWQVGRCVYALAALVCGAKGTHELNRVALSMAAASTGRRERGAAAGARLVAAAGALPVGLGGCSAARRTAIAAEPSGVRLLVLLARAAQSAHLPSRAHGAAALAHALGALSPALVEWDFALCQYALTAPLTVREMPQLRAALPALPALARVADAAPTASASRGAHGELVELLIAELRHNERRPEQRRAWLRTGAQLAAAIAPDALSRRAHEALDCGLDAAAACATDLLGSPTRGERRAQCAADVTLAFELVDAIARSAWPRLGAHAVRVLERALPILARAVPLMAVEHRPPCEKAFASLVRALWLCEPIAACAALDVARAELARMSAPRRSRTAGGEHDQVHDASREEARAARHRCAREAAAAVERVRAIALADKGA